jgi:hypothetical protein
MRRILRREVRRQTLYRTFRVFFTRWIHNLKQFTLRRRNTHCGKSYLLLIRTTEITKLFLLMYLESTMAIQAGLSHIGCVLSFSRNKRFFRP